MEENINQESKPEHQEQKNIKTCPTCGNPYEVKPGTVWKRLFKKPTANEWITLALIVLVILAALAYKRDISVCQDTIQNIKTVCLGVNNIPSNITIGSLNNITFPSIPDIDKSIQTNETNETT
jgi:hypothetical protein